MMAYSPRTTWRCIMCNVNYPAEFPDGTPCAVCDGELRAMTGVAPHQDWERRVARLLEAQDKENKVPALPNVDTNIRKHRRSKTLWVQKSALLAAGYHNIKTFHVVQINNKYYEIQGFDPKKQEFWIEEIKVELDEKELYSQL